ncbi:hypothetical protein CAPTEDRAFT_175237 [Capitella teleta]|uniref:Replication factor C subunit 1 n=1 Tax=Capitella teleta TaxID=283909 RepID=R7VAU2_CAPTE|nr:hypothetical protein CAPTEDRAFT_175237 [Capitella teleta]|eukprot:ELU15704.1 hypothetical protein CAPTEDRAFT_175237 [Capitella teleta]
MATDQASSAKKGAYRSYLSREGPRALGSKEIPQGAENCLEGLTFVITGVLESMERSESQSLIERYGGKVTGSLSKRTSYVVVGRDAGESKMAKANQLGTKQLDEDGLLDLIRKLPGKTSKYEIEAAKQSQSKPSTAKFKSSPSLAKISQSKMSSAKPAAKKATDEGSSQSLMWVDKYKPQTLKQIIGQTGDKSNARKLMNWLQNWHRNISSGKKPAFNRFSDDGSGFKAALLSGPPGVGKTTTATLVCKEAGFSFVELNASDTRSKRKLKDEVSESLNNHTLVDFFGGQVTPSEGQRHCLVMDEVDGMAGNEDRGGVAELIQLIKNSKIPVICMCNDRNHQKIRSLANHCFDLRFQRPRVEQIKAAMMSVAFKEGLKISPPALQEVIVAANQDVRQIMHNLSMWTSTDRNLSYDQAKSDANKAKKDAHLGPFDVCRQVFAGGERMSVIDKTDLFFQDYSFGPLFVQENYPSCTPFAARGDMRMQMKLLSQAADSIAQGDLVDRQIRSTQNWGLLPTQAIFSTVLPGEAMKGSIGQMIQFPQWLGKNSTRNKNDRTLQELRTHMGLKNPADKHEINMDYLPLLRKALTQPLATRGAEGIGEIIQVMDEYSLTREDFDSLLEVATWPNSKNCMANVDSKVKAAFTRTYNKSVHLTPYATGSSVAKKKRGAGGGEELEEEEGGEVEEEEEEEEDITKDSMIKLKKKPAAKAAKATGKGKAGKSGSKGKLAKKK